MDFKDQLNNINEQDSLVNNKTIFTINATQPNIVPNYRESISKFDDSPWVLDLVGPKLQIDSYSNIFVMDEYRLIGYSLSDGMKRMEEMGGNGYIFAIPKDSNVTASIGYEFQKDMSLKTPKPKNSLPHFMMSIDGDRSPLSYLQAAISYHELSEYRALWHGISWRRDIILPINGDIDELNNYKWNMFVEEPETIEPHFYYDENNMPTIVFYTINDIVTVELIEYKHIFDKENYNLKVKKKYIGEAGAGMIF